MLPVVGVRVSVTFHLMFVHIILVRSRLLSGHLFGKSCLLTRLTICSLCILTIGNFSYFPFWFWGQNFGSDCSCSWSLLLSLVCGFCSFLSVLSMGGVVLL